MTDTNEEPKLLPCPFCGSNEIGTVGTSARAYACNDCGANGAFEVGDFENPEPWERILELWNTRVAVSETASDDHQSSLASVDEAQPVAWRYRDAISKAWANPEYNRRSYYGRIDQEEQPLYAHPAPERCYVVKEGWSIRARRDGDELPHHWRNLSDSLTLSSVDDVRREAFEEAAKLMEHDGVAGNIYHALLIRKLAEK